MKIAIKYFGRFLGSLITLPLVLLAYLFIFGMLIGLGAGDNGEAFNNLWGLGFAWIVVFTFYPIISKWLEPRN